MICPEELARFGLVMSVQPLCFCHLNSFQVNYIINAAKALCISRLRL